jgi:lysophospholipase L1-like esterase
MRAAAASLIVLTLIGAWGCSGGSPNRPTPTPTPQPQPQPPTPPTVTPDPPAGPSTPPPSPRLAKARFVAFGDSLTEGVVSSSLMFTLVDIPSAYPARLATALRTRYYDQTDIVVLNEGKAGEFALDGKVRLPDVIKTDAPQVVLLMEGANELNVMGRRGVSRAVGALEDMIKDARRRGCIVFVATLPPQRASGVNGFGAPYVEELNAQIRKTAADEGATLVDVYPQFDLSLVGQDGLHLTEAGYVRLGAIFADAIRQSFETPPPS